MGDWSTYSGEGLFLDALQDEIGSWSMKNFGKQDVVNPLLGVGEELLAEYPRGVTTEEEELDAIADTAIFLFDFLDRSHYRLSHCLDTLTASEVGECRRVRGQSGMILDASQHYGGMLKAALKLRQGIRKMSGEAYDQRIMRGAGLLYCTMDMYARKHFNRTLYDISREVFKEVVSRRNWVEFPEAGSVSV